MKFSIIVAAFNCEKFIDEAIKSCLEQDFEDFEVIVVNDASTDGTVGRIRAFLSDRRVRLVSHDKNKGILASRLTGLECATGEYVFFLDGDDYFLPNAFSSFNEKTVGRPDIIFCSMFDGATKSVWPKYKCNGRNVSVTKFYFKNVRNFCWTSATKVVIREKALNLLEDLSFVKKRVCLAEDYLIYSSLLRYIDTCAVVENPVYFYRDSSAIEKNYPGKEANISERLEAYEYVLHCVSVLGKRLLNKKSSVPMSEYESRMLLADALMNKIIYYSQMHLYEGNKILIRIRYYKYVINKCGLLRFILFRLNKFI